MENSFPFQPAENTLAASWLISGWKGFFETVESLIPAGYEAYARIYHPVWLEVGGLRTRLTWQDVAKENNRTVHREMQWYGVGGGHPLLDSDGYRSSDTTEAELSGKSLEIPAMGTVPLEIVQPLWRILANYTTTAGKCWFAVWEGFDYPGPNSRPAAPRFGIPERNYYLFSAPLEAIEQSFNIAPIHQGSWRFHQTANVWWPDDRAWCVATEIDFMTTYVGGTKEAMAAIVASPAFEADLVELSDSVNFDTLNTPPK